MFGHMAMAVRLHKQHRQWVSGRGVQVPWLHGNGKVNSVCDFVLDNRPWKKTKIRTLANVAWHLVPYISIETLWLEALCLRDFQLGAFEFSHL